ncbi:MAG: LysR family transcriptional regulator substrate-binding protein [Deferrisomatales bacterium]
MAAPGSPLARRDRVGWGDLARSPLVLHCEGSVARQRLLEEFRRRGAEPQVAAEIDNVEGMKQWVRQGGGGVPSGFAGGGPKALRHEPLGFHPTG